MAVLIGEGSVNLLRLLEVYLLIHILPFNMSFIKPLIATAAAVISVFLVGAWIPGGFDLLHAFIGAPIMCLVYAATLLMLGFSVEERNLFKSVYNQVRNKLKR
jgi:hypothetical protein